MPDAPRRAWRGGRRARMTMAGDTARATRGPGAQLLALWRSLRASAARRRIVWTASGILFTIGANAIGQIRLNAWQGDFYDALEGRKLDEFLHQSLVFVGIVAVLLTLVVSQTWLTETLKLRLRDWLTGDLLDRWLAPGRAYRLRLSGEIGRNPDQRLHADAQHLTQLTAGLGIGLVQSSLLLVSFVGVLWTLSANVTFHLGDRSFGIPGYMVWCALGYSLAGSLLAWAVGRPLVRIDETLYASEADLRYGLVHVSESSEGVALYRGEADERARLGLRLATVIDVMRQRAWGLAQLTWVTSGYGWLAIVVPVLVAAPGYFMGDISFGTLMMVVGAFNQVQSSLRWFVDNVATIADWRATLLRVMALRDALETIDETGSDGDGRPRIRFTRNDRPVLELVGLSVALREDDVRIAEGDLRLERGERLLVLGGPEVGKSTLFRAIAGVWPWGEGEIRLPEPDGMLFLPNKPYLPPGPLRAALAYPAPADSIEDARARGALESVGLGHRAEDLDEKERWESELGLDEQQRIAFARALLLRPAWLFLDDAGSALGSRQRRALIETLTRDRPDMSIIAFRRDDDSVDATLFPRKVHVVRDEAESA